MVMVTASWFGLRWALLTVALMPAAGISIVATDEKPAAVAVFPSGSTAFAEAREDLLRRTGLRTGHAGKEDAEHQRGAGRAEQLGHRDSWSGRKDHGTAMPREPVACRLEGGITSGEQVRAGERSDFIRLDAYAFHSPAGGVLMVGDRVHQHVAIGKACHHRRQRHAPHWIPRRRAPGRWPASPR
jgi:hypothetical protein